MHIEMKTTTHHVSRTAFVMCQTFGSALPADYTAVIHDGWGQGGKSETFSTVAEAETWIREQSSR